MHLADRVWNTYCNYVNKFGHHHDHDNIPSSNPLSVFSKVIDQSNKYIFFLSVQFIMDQYAASIKSDIELFLLKYVPSISLIRANNKEILGSLKIERDELSSEETDKLIYYLVGTFPQMRGLGCHDISELVHDTVKFVIQKSKEKGRCSSFLH